MLKTAVVILNWNGERHLKQFLPSVVDSLPCGGNVEVVVADNGSTDGSVELIRSSFPTVKLLLLDRNYGYAQGYNIALEQIQAKYYILLNSDVETLKGWIEPLVEELDRSPRVAAVAPKILSYVERDKFEYAGASGGFIDYLGYPFCRGRILKTTEVDRGQYDNSRNVFWASGAALCCRAEVFHQLGGFDADFFAHMEEIDLCWRMQLVGHDVMVVPRSCVYHLGGGTLATDSPNKVFLNHRNNLAMLYKCAPTSQRVVVAVVRPILDALAALSYLLQGRADNCWAVARAYADFIRWHARLSEKRKTVRGGATTESKHIFRGSIVLKYMFGHKSFDDLM